MVAVSLLSRRQLRRAGLRALHAIEHHYLSLISAGILAVALAVALTNSGFDVSSGATAPPAAAIAPAPSGPSPSGGAQSRATPPAAARSFVYYVVDSPTQKAEIEMAVQADLSVDSLRDFPPLHSTSRAFLVIQDARDEAEVLEFLRQLAISPPLDGTNVRVVDLR